MGTNYIVNKPEFLKVSSMAGKEREVTEIDDSCPFPHPKGTPLRPIFSLKEREETKKYDEIEDCYILEFDPYDDQSKLSSSKDFDKAETGLHVVAEKGQVACRDYPHPRHTCVKYPFEKKASRRFLKKGKKEWKQVRNLKDIVNKPEVQNLSSMAGKEREITEIAYSCPSPDPKGTPWGPIFCLDKRDEIKKYDEIEDCYILEFDPYDDHSKLSSSKDFDNAETDSHVAAEKGQVACRDYPHPRHTCVTYPFEKKASRQFLKKGKKEWRQVRNLKDIVNKPEVQKLSSMAGKEREVTEIDDSCPSPDPKGIFCLDKRDEIKKYDEIEDCYILEFDPYDDQLRLSSSKDFDNAETDSHVVAEKGQVAHGDYPHPRHACVKYPFEKTPHNTHCKLCYCYVCDLPAPCSKWIGSGGHCHAFNNEAWTKEKKERRRFLTEVRKGRRQLRNPKGIVNKPEFRKISSMAGKEREVTESDDSCPSPDPGKEREVTESDDSCPSPDPKGPPLRPIFCLKNKDEIKKYDEIEDCYILEFDPYDDHSKLSSKDFENADADLHVVAEKGQVACRDYPHPRHICAKYPFEKTPHATHCKLCYCYVCDLSAPCSKWVGLGGHCHAFNSEAWNKRKEQRRQLAQTA